MTITFAEHHTAEWIRAHSEYTGEMTPDDVEWPELRWHFTLDRRLGEPEFLGCSMGDLALTKDQVIAALGKDRFRYLHEMHWEDAMQHERGRQECIASERGDA